jgi:hypothetical protein
LDAKEKEINTLKVIFKNAITENNHYLQTDLLSQLLSTSYNGQHQQQYVNNYNSNNQRNSINTPSPTPNLSSLNVNNNSNSNSHSSSPHQLDPNA